MKITDYGEWVTVLSGDEVLFLKPYQVRGFVGTFILNSIVIDGEYFLFWWGSEYGRNGTVPLPMFPLDKEPPSLPGFIWDKTTDWGWVLRVVK